MENYTAALLRECNKGCKMAIDSMDHLKEYVKDPKLKTVIQSCENRHEIIEKESANILEGIGHEEKDPGIMAATFAKITTEMKMMMEKDERQVSKILMNGCNMGIQSIGEALSDNQGASEESKELARDLIGVEENFMQDLKNFL